MNQLTVGLLAAGLLLGLAAPAFAFQCPSDVAKIDAAMVTAELTDAQKQEVQQLRDEGERLHVEGQHQQAVDTLAQAKAILGIE